jgi:GT2 family glycosyltransferase
VVITRNRPDILRQCLERLADQSIRPFETVVVDSSDDDRTKRVCSKFTGVTYVRFERGKNRMPTARNLGILHSRAGVVAYLDDDCLVDEDWVEQLGQTYASHPSAAGVGGRITDARWKYDPTAPVGRVDELGRVTSNFFGDPGGAPAVDILPGGNMSFRREWLERVGGFDPGYTCTNHREDPDLCLRIRRAGGELRYQPAAHALHLNARNSLGELRPRHEFFLRYSFARNDTYFVVKHFGNRTAALFRTLVIDTLTFVRSAMISRSLVHAATVPVFLVAKLVGLAVGTRSRAARMLGGREDHMAYLAGTLDEIPRSPEAAPGEVTVSSLRA